MPKHVIEGLDRGLAAAEFVALRPRASLSEVTAWLQVSKATSFRVLTTLTARGWLTHDPGSGYQAGPTLMRMAMTGTGARLRAVAEEPLVALARETGETVNLATLIGGRVRYERVIDGHRSLRMYVDEGGESWAHATSLGKAILAELPEPQVRGALGEEPFEAVTPKTLTTYADLFTALRTTRERGYGLEVGEDDEEAACIAAAVRGGSGETVGAVSVCAPRSRVTPELIDDYAAQVVRAAGDISTRLQVAPM